MTEKELVELCGLGETTTVQYKLEFTTQKQIAEEMVAFANTRGGIIIFGAEDKTGKMVGLSYEQLQYTSRELGNTANEHVRPAIYVDIDTVKHDDMAFMIAYVKNGTYKPYKDLSGNNGQTLDEIMMGNSDPRNPQVALFGSKTMPYRGLGSGIPRVMATGCDVELINHPDGNQFVARVWRTTQKDEIATQKANESLAEATQKGDTTTRKQIGTTRKPLNTTQKDIISYLKEHPTATRQEVADAIGDITEDGIKFNIGKLQQYGFLRREGGRKKGVWVVMYNDK